MQPLQLILASGSPRRRELLTMLGIPFQVVVSDTDESLDEHIQGPAAVEELAERKAQAVAAMLEHSDAVVIGADTVVSIDGEILGKPVDPAHALATLSQLQGRRHDVYTGVCVLNMQTGKQLVSHVHTKVWMRPRDTAWLQAYIASGEPMDKAGAYGIQGLGSLLVERIDGDFYSVMGLPLNCLDRLLAQVGAPIDALSRML